MPQIVVGEEFVLALQIAVALVGAYLAAFWLGLVVWTYRDAKARSSSALTHLFAVVLVILFNVPGLVLYLILRPSHTLTERYERSLEEEAMLQELDKKLACPTCKRDVQLDFLLCPECLTKLKQACPRCGRPLGLTWKACPYCAFSLTSGVPVEATRTQEGG